MTTVFSHAESVASSLEYDGQYTSSDTGLIYLRNRVYDPSTMQFLSVDPFEEWTGEPYSYVGDNPLNHDDPRGLFPWGPIAEGLGIGATCLLGPEVCVPVGLADLDAHVIAADINSAETGCSPWSQIGPALLGAGVGALPFAGGVVAKEVWAASEGAFRVGAGVGLAAGSLAGAAASSANAATSGGASASCGCSGG
jgi:RHS repeat-associated protein